MIKPMVTSGGSIVVTRACDFRNFPEDVYYANGNRQQLVMVFPSHQAVIVRLGWTSGRYPVAENFARILEAL